MPLAADNAAQLERRLVLATWFARMLGYSDNATMLADLKNSEEGWGDECHKTLERISAKGEVIVEWRLLKELDEEIRVDWNAINANRRQRLTLKYFQYLAALASGLFLRRLADSPDAFLAELQRFSQSGGLVTESLLPFFDDVEDLKKLAFWMATGSGKTLLMHLHYHQFLRHRHAILESNKPDNVLLLTPNEELSRQHIAEMRASGITCFHHNDNTVLLHTATHAVRVIEITKLISATSKRKGKGKGKGDSVPVQAFAGRNLIFVDEGHKGAGGEEWFNARDELAKDGFVFEYSATFGQALNAALLNTKKPTDEKKAKEYDRAKDYARAIVFDYSYHYFHGDGYGKDFAVLNIQETSYDDTMRDVLMLGNLLSFFEQRLVFANCWETFIPYQVESPLLLMLGAEVTGGKNPSAGRRREQTDIVEIVGFLHRVACDKNKQNRAWLSRTIKNILNGKSGVMVNDENGEEKDVFADRFVYLKEFFPAAKDNADALCDSLRRHVFHAEAANVLRFCPLKQAKGEIALKVGDGNEPFALIYVGNTDALCKLVQDCVSGVEVGNDAIQRPLFAGVHLPASPINLLIGAKKFMEGWSSWRVCGMGLVNVGKREGAQIIQLFGRGIRLKGKNFSLKRSQLLHERHPKWLPLLETLNIFAVNADFMRQFREYLEREGYSESIAIPITVREEAIKKEKLLLPNFNGGAVFEDAVDLAAGEDISLTLDMATKTQTIAGGEGRFAMGGGNEEQRSPFSECQGFELLDYDRLHRRLLDYKRQSGRSNLVIRREELRPILDDYEIYGGAMLLSAAPNPDTMRRLHNAAFAALRKYAERLYFRRQKQWETKNISYAPLTPSLFSEQEASESSTGYEVRMLANQSEKINKIRGLIKNMEILRKHEDEDLPRVYIAEHLYMPLLLEGTKIMTVSPPGLTVSEKDFVVGLRDYLRNNPLKNQDKVFLLRNPSKGKGIGFYESEGFYPDFILWIKRGKKQKIIFVEPHGMMHAVAYKNDFKARLWKEVHKLSEKLAKNRKWRDVGMDSFIVSETPFKELRKRYDDGKWTKEKFRKHHILFKEDELRYATILGG